MSGVTKMAWDVMSGVTKTAWDVLSGVANLCGMFCPGCKKMAWDVLSRDVLSGSPSHYLPLKNIKNIEHTQKIFEILATLKNVPILYTGLKKIP